MWNKELSYTGTSIHEQWNLEVIQLKTWHIKYQLKIQFTGRLRTGHCSDLDFF